VGDEPQLDLGRFVLGAAIFHSSRSFVQDFDLLTIPGYTTVSPFLHVRVLDKVKLSVNVNNVFNATGITHIFDSGLTQAGGFQSAQTVPGRTVSATLKVDF
jgi:outer membrane receptor protein involved in Fe transport